MHMLSCHAFFLKAPPCDSPRETGAVYSDPVLLALPQACGPSSTLEIMMLLCLTRAVRHGPVDLGSLC